MGFTSYVFFHVNVKTISHKAAPRPLSVMAHNTMAIWTIYDAITKLITDYPLPAFSSSQPSLPFHNPLSILPYSYSNSSNYVLPLMSATGCLCFASEDTRCHTLLVWQIYVCDADKRTAFCGAGDFALYACADGDNALA